MVKEVEKCILCNKTISKSSGCDFDYIINDAGKSAKRLPAEKDCKKCGVKKNKLHHLYCSEEICPICREILDSKKCKHDWVDCAKAGEFANKIKKEVIVITASQFILLTLITFGLFPFYWMYRTWRFFLALDGKKTELDPKMLTLLWPLFIWEFSKRIKIVSKKYYHHHTSTFVVPIMIIGMYISWMFDITLLGLVPFVFIPFLNFLTSMNYTYSRMFPEKYMI